MEEVTINNSGIQNIEAATMAKCETSGNNASEVTQSYENQTQSGALHASSQSSATAYSSSNANRNQGSMTSSPMNASVRPRTGGTFSGNGGYRRPGSPGGPGGQSGEKRSPRRGGSSFRREKQDKIAVEKLIIDYKQPEILKRFLTERGKILSRYVTGNSAKNQRRLVREVKRARYVGLLPSA